VILRLGKDRPGTIKRHCGPLLNSDRTQEAARIVIDSTGGQGIDTPHIRGEGSREATWPPHRLTKYQMVGPAKTREPRRSHAHN
jgi:hypothetical protein